MDSTRQLTAEPEIRLYKIQKTFKTEKREKQVIADISLDIKKNEFVVLFGVGQCGKTTLLKMIAGLEKPTSGQILIKGKESVGVNPEVGMVYQTTELFPWLTTMGNVEFGPKTRGVPKAERRKIAQHYIDLVGLKGFENHYPVKLSGGMSQRVGIARAYCNNPEIILMDEPFGHLDAQTRYMMEEEIERIWASDKRTVLFVTNNIEEAIYLADRIIIMTDCPAVISRAYEIDLPRPRSMVDPKFLALREEISTLVDIPREGQGIDHEH